MTEWKRFVKWLKKEKSAEKSTNPTDVKPVVNSIQHGYSSKSWEFSRGSWANLKGVNPKLVAVATLAMLNSPYDFGITEGVRSKERQRWLVNQGKSKNLKSRHLTGDAIDIAIYVDGKLTWEWQYYEKVSEAFKQAAKELGVDLTWGGDWESLKDGVHYQV